eukprot:2101159-Prymnesium_polylepis.1
MLAALLATPLPLELLCDGEVAAGAFGGLREAASAHGSAVARHLVLAHALCTLPATPTLWDCAGDSNPLGLCRRLQPFGA